MGSRLGNNILFTKSLARYCHFNVLPLKTYIPVYSTSLDYGLSTRKPVECQGLNSQIEVQIRDYLFTGKYFLPRIIKSQV